MNPTIVPGSEPLEIGETAPHTTRWHAVEVPGSGGNGAGVIPVAVLAGDRPHPCLAVVGGVHGDEYDGIRAGHEISRKFDPGQLKGTIIVVTVANPFAFAAARRRTPEDDTDLNRVFPGRPNGSRTERLAQRLTTGILQQADFIFTLHGAMADGVLTRWIEFLNEPGPIGQASYAAARAAGFPDLVGLPKELPGRLLTTLSERGIPVIEGEVGGCGALRPENVAYYVERVTAVARHLGVVDGTSATSETEPGVWQLAGRHVHAPAAGIFEREVELKQAVRAGDQIGRIVGASGDIIAELLVEEDAVVAGYREHAGVHRGDALVTLWTKTTLRVDDPSP